jgi:PAS domain S-box-containing protein
MSGKARQAEEKEPRLEKEAAAGPVSEQGLAQEGERLEQADASRLHADRLLAAIVESSDDAIVSKSLDGIIQTWNAAAERLFGFSAEEAVGRHISLIIPPERAAEEDRIIETLKAARRIDHFDTVRLRKDGQPVLVSLTISPVRDEAGRVVGASKIARDITERRRLEDNLRRLAADLSEADRRKDEFLATLAHELRNPLAPIRNALQILRLSPDPTAQEQARALMQRQLEQMVRLVDDLLDVSRISTGKIQLRREPVRLQEVVHNAVEISRPAIDHMSHQLTVTLPEQPLVVDGDPTRLAQVFSNLLNNSAKYTARGGHIELRAERQGNDALLSVKDNGIGIAADHLPGLFQMFAQVHSARDRAQGGLGIGLTLVKRLVEMHGGNVDVKSAGLGLGSEFIVRMPLLVDVPDAAVPVKQVETPAPRSSLRVLIVDDNRDSADSLAMLLRIMGNDIRTAYDGQRGVEEAEAFRPNVVLLDIGLPKLDGYEACRRIREEAWGREMVLIAVTGWGQEDDRRRSHEAGFDYHLVKPVDPHALMNMLADLERARPKCA